MKMFDYYLLRILIATLALAPFAIATDEGNEPESVLKLNSPSATPIAEATQPLANTQTKEDAQENEARGLASGYGVVEHYDDVQHGQNVAKPLKNIFMGIYKNYKSTYLGNKTSLEYKKRLKDRVQLAAALAEAKIREAELEKQIEVANIEMASAEESGESDDEIMQAEEDNIGAAQMAELTRQKIRERLELATALARERQKAAAAEQQDVEDDGVTIEEVEPAAVGQTRYPADANEAESSKAQKKRRKRKRKPQIKVKPKSELQVEDEQEHIENEPINASTPSENLDRAYHYDLGGGVNVNLDMSEDIVSIKLDGNNLLEVVNGRWLTDNTEEGRGKKYEMVTKVLPLFILPFLIQSAIVPFLVTKLKLLLVKSILVGKLAIFLLIISAIKNSNKPMQTYEVAPSYWAGEPSRRSELAAAASSMAYNGYRVEGKPAAWVN